MEREMTRRIVVPRSVATRSTRAGDLELLCLTSCARSPNRLFWLVAGAATPAGMGHWAGGFALSQSRSFPSGFGGGLAKLAWPQVGLLKTSANPNWS